MVMTETTDQEELPAEDVSRAELIERLETLERKLTAEDANNGPGKMVIIATKGTLDMAYPPLILASTAAAFGYDVTVFHTFWGLDILHEERSKKLQISAVGNPNMSLPNIIATLPGMDHLTTRMMRRRIESNNVATIADLIEIAIETGVDLQACQMTIDLLGYDEDEFYSGVTTGVGAAAAFSEMAEADIQLLV